MEQNKALGLYQIFFFLMVMFWILAFAFAIDLFLFLVFFSIAMIFTSIILFIGQNIRATRKSKKSGKGKVLEYL